MNEYICCNNIQDKYDINIHIIKNLNIQYFI